MISIESALPSDLPTVQDLVAAAALPLDGLGDVPTEVFVARDGPSILGTAALEEHGGHGLLRSVAVEEGLRGSGIGSALVAAVEQHAAERGFDGLYLLTDTAPEFFARRGYDVIGRDAGPAPIMASLEWTSACGEAAVPMVLTLP